MSNFSEIEDALKGEETTEEKTNLFLKEYNDLVNSLINEYPVDSIDVQASKIQYMILDEYYQAIIDSFIMNGKTRVAIQYYYKRLYLNQKYFEKSHNIGVIYYSISNIYLELKRFELSFNTIGKAIDYFSKFLEAQNDDL